MKNRAGIPAGHTFHVSLLLLMPESDYNRQIGLFQLTAEVVSETGNVKLKSSQPCMLRYRSLPIRLLRTFIMGVPLILGISEETQKISVDMVKYKEGYPRTKAIKFTLVSTAGSWHPPQLYEAEILLKSHPPWTKEFVRGWKWTCCIWVSLYIYAILLAALFSCCSWLIVPPKPSYFSRFEGGGTGDQNAEEFKRGRDEGEISELWRKWHQRRKKRKMAAASSQGGGEGMDETEPGTVCSSASTMSLTGGEEISGGVPEEEDVGDSETTYSDE